VIEPAVKQLASNGDAEIGDLGEVRQPHAARALPRLKCSRERGYCLI
jgi:hypothetical protein